MGLSISINEAAAFDVTIAIPGPAGPGVPTGGLSGQILSKASNANYDTSWVNITDVSAVWGQITGSLSNQIDLSNALAAKYDASNPAGYITSAALAPYITSATAASTYYPLTNPAGYISGVNWGSIGGSITSQLDLQTALGGKADLTGATFTGGISTQSGSNIIGIDPLGTWVQITDGTDAISLSPSGITYPDFTVQTTAFTGTAASTWGQIGGLLANQTDLSTELSGKAPAAAGIPVGGITGQLLAKASNNNYDSAWTTVIPGDRYLSTSSTSLLIGNGTKTLTIGTGLSYSATQDITVALTSDPNNYHMHGKVTSYVAGTGVLVIDVQSHTGSGTFNAWTVNVGGLSPVTSLAWGNITGTLSNQIDLQTALDGKYSTSNPAGYITSSALSPYLLSATAASTYYPLANPAGYITSSALSPYLLSSTAASTYYPLTNPSGYITSSALTGYAQLSGAAFTGNVTASANSISARRIIGQPNAGVAGVNVGIGGDSTNSTTPGDLWITTGGANLNFRDGTGAWKVIASLQNGNVFSAVQTVDVNSASTALRVTQRGTGEAFRVEDSTTPDATPFVIDSNGRVAIGGAVDATAVLKVYGSAGGVDFNGLALYLSGSSYIQFTSGVLGGTGEQPNPNTGGSFDTVVYPYEVLVKMGSTWYAMPARQLP